MAMSLTKILRIVSVVALACVSTFVESRGTGGGPGPLPTTGTCGFAFTNSYPFAYLHGSNPGDGWGTSVLGTINFQTRTISVNIILIDPAPLPSIEAPFSFTTTFTTSPGPIPGSSTITFSIPNDPTVVTINLIAVNGGKTILMQLYSPTAGSQDGSDTGRCEM